MRKPWPPPEIEKLKKLKGMGLSDFEIAEKLNRSYESVNIKLSRLRQAGELPTSQVPGSNMPLWTDPLRSEGDAVILSDVEAPFQHSEFINRVLDLADAWGIQILHLDGDLLHNDSLSAWGAEWVSDKSEIVEAVLDTLAPLLSEKKKAEATQVLADKGFLESGTYTDEMQAARRVFRSLDSFKEIYVALGNHDDRYLRALNQALKPKELLIQLDVDKDPRWKIAPYYYSLIDTEAGTYRITHPRGAAKATAINLAIQNHQHVIMGHSHRWAVNRDPSAKYWAIQQGHCVDEKRLAYVQQRDAVRDAHALGATIIRDGFPFVLCEQSPWDILRRM